MEVQDLQPGDILAVNEPSFIFHLIEDITKAPVGHVSMYMGEGLCFEENGFCAVDNVPAAGYLAMKGTYILRIKGLTSDKLKGIMNYLEAHKGQAYDYTEILALLIKYEFGYLLHHHNLNKSICSTIIARALKENGIEPFEDVDSVVPGDYLKSSFFEVIHIV